jgi:hypothetical protein
MVERHMVVRTSELIFARRIAVVVVTIDRWTSGEHVVRTVVSLW